MDCNPIALVDPWGASTDDPPSGGGDFTYDHGGSGGNRESFSPPPVPGSTSVKGQPNILTPKSFMPSSNQLPRMIEGNATQDEFKQILSDVNQLVVNEMIRNTDAGVTYHIDADIQSDGKYYINIEKATLNVSMQGPRTGDNCRLIESNGNSDSWTTTATHINNAALFVFECGKIIHTGLEKVYTAEALTNNRLADGGVKGKWTVLRESGKTMMKIRRIANVGGGIFAFIGGVFSVVDIAEGYMEKDTKKMVIGACDIVVTAALFASGVGIVGIPIWYIYKEIVDDRFYPIHLEPFNPDMFKQPHYHIPDNTRVDNPYKY